MSYLDDEGAIIWLEMPEALAYVRALVETSASTRGRKLDYRGNGRVVGYSVLKPSAENNGSRGRFTRRVFWLADWDRDRKPYGAYRIGCPMEAVDPMTVEPGVAGKLTPRAWGCVCLPGTKPGGDTPCPQCGHTWRSASRGWPPIIEPSGPAAASEEASADD